MTTRATPTSHRYFSQRLRLHYLDWGNAGATDLLLLHGVQDHCHSWDWFADAFADRFHVVAPDLRGHGDSEWVHGSGYHQLDYVYDLDQLVRQRALAPLHIVGHSMGGTLAALYAGLFPESVAALVLIEAVGLWPDWSGDAPAHERVRGWIDHTRQLAARVPRRYPSWDAAYARMLHANPHLSPEQARHLARHGSHQNEDGSYSWKYDNYTHAWPVLRMPESDVVSLWKRIACPVLIVNGSDGYPHRIGQEGTLAHFRHAEMIAVRGAGHWVHHDRFDAVAQAVRRFFDAVDSGEPADL
jgi:pimeloyl-ACP methyl ester carboxylesterase